MTFNKPDNSLSFDDISTSRVGYRGRGEPAFLKLGGTTLYAASVDRLNSVVRVVSDAIDQATSQYLLLAKASIAKLVQESIIQDVGQTIFGAVLARNASLGILDSLVCLTVNSRTFRVYAHFSRREELCCALDTVKTELRKNGTLSVLEVKRMLFPDRTWGSHSASIYLLSHLCFRGWGVYLDSELFGWPREIEDAVNFRD